MDFDSKKFNGYLIDKNQPYNMYLKVGIGGNMKNEHLTKNLILLLKFNFFFGKLFA